jgi:hypothetical protein
MKIDATVIGRSVDFYRTTTSGVDLHRSTSSKEKAMPFKTGLQEGLQHKDNYAKKTERKDEPYYDL